MPSDLLARWLGDVRWPFVLGGLALVATTPALWTGLLIDDYVHRAAFLRLPGFEMDPTDIFAFVRGIDATETMRRLAAPWWTLPELKLAFWRPLTSLTHALDYALWPDAPWAMHLHSMLWFAGLVTVVGVLFRRFFEVAWHAGVAAFVYAMSQTHAVPVFFIANRNALIGAFFASIALLLHVRWRRHGKRDAAMLAPAAFLLGLLAHEGAIAACAYLFAYAVFIDAGPRAQRASSLAPYAAIVLAWRIAYQLQGYGAWGSQSYIDPVTAPLQFLGALVVRLPVYVLAEWLFPPADLMQLVPGDIRTAWHIGAIGFFVLHLALLIPLIRRQPSARFWLAGMLLALAPSCATAPMDRMLLYSGIGFAALVTQWVVAVLGGHLFPPTARAWRMMARVMCDVFIVLHLVLAPLRLSLGIHTAARGFDAMTNGVEELAKDPELSGKLVVLIDDVLITGTYFPALRALAGLPPAGQVAVLAPVRSRFDSLVLARTAPNALVMTIDGGYEWFLERDDRHPFAVGDVVRWNRVTARVLQIDDEGKPTKVAFEFDAPLEDSSIAWFARLEPATAAFPLNGRYPRWTPPPVGQAVALK